MTHNLSVDADRLWADVMALAEITDPARPFTRRSFSPLFLKGRDWLRARFEDAGLSTRIDAAGNLIGRRESADPALGTIAVGSHSDTVPSGGRFDGIAGVIAGLEIARSLRDRDVTLHHALEVIDFLAEEPSEYGLSCVGSRGMTGALDATHLSLTSPDGESLQDAMRRVDGQPELLAEAKRTDLRAFLELHIEQGRVLEEQGLDVGIVTSIAGIRRLEIIFEGAADHAGTTPMPLRRDALVAGARTITLARELAETLSRKAFFVATVGLIEVSPNAANVVPGRCRLLLDIRTSDVALTDEFVSVVDRESRAFAQDARVARNSFRVLSDGVPVDCDAGLQDALRKGAAALGLSAIDLASGAGHDAAFISRICPAAMLFIPCREGRSHAPEEWAERDALAAGTAVVLDAVRAIDDRLARAAHAGAM